MVATHAVALPALYLFASRFHAPAFVLLALEVAASVLWHLSHPGYLDETLVARPHAQAFDYFMIGLIFSYLLLQLISLSEVFVQTVFITNIFLLALFMPLLPTTPVFSFFLVGFSAFLFIYRLIVMRGSHPMRRIDYLQLVCMLVIGGSALVLYNAADNCDDPNYIWSHQLWHVIVYGALDVFAAILVGIQVFKFFGIEPNYTRFEVSLRDKARFANPGLPIASFANSYYNKN